MPHFETIRCPAISRSACSGPIPPGRTSRSGDCPRRRGCGRRGARRPPWQQPPQSLPLGPRTAPQWAVEGSAVQVGRRSRRARRRTRSGRRRTTPRAVRKWRASPFQKKVRHSFVVPNSDVHCPTVHLAFNLQVATPSPRLERLRLRPWNYLREIMSHLSSMDCTFTSYYPQYG